MQTRAFHAETGSRFGQKLAEEEASKRVVAKRATAILAQMEADRIFIPDGTSASYLWHYLLVHWKNARAEAPLTVYTNNVDVPLQVLHDPGAPRRIVVNMAPGHVDFESCAMMGEQTDAWIAEKCRGSVCVMAVTALDSELGPGSHGEEARKIKRAILENAHHLIVIADQSKLQFKREALHGMAVGTEAWLRWRDEMSKQGRLVLVTSLSPSVTVPYTRSVCNTFPDKRTPLQIENENAARLRQTVGGHFVVASPDRDCTPAPTGVAA